MGTGFHESNYYHLASMYANVLDDFASHMPRLIISDIFRDWPWPSRGLAEIF